MVSHRTTRYLRLALKDVFLWGSIICLWGPIYTLMLVSLEPTSTKNWKNQPLLITGEWAAPEMSNMPIPLEFGRKPVLPSDKRYLLSEDRIAWLEENLAGRGWDITRFLDLATLIRLSIAHLFKDICSVDVELCCIEDLASLIQASFQEREAELAQHSSSEDCVSGSKSDQSYMSAPRSLSVLGFREKRSGKELEPSGFAKKSRHASQVVWVWAHPMYLLQVLRPDFNKSLMPPLLLAH
ncbi:unnamed protein product [Prunus armeniaca]